MPKKKGQGAWNGEEQMDSLGGMVLTELANHVADADGLDVRPSARGGDPPGRAHPAAAKNSMMPSSSPPWTRGRNVRENDRFPVSPILQAAPEIRVAVLVSFDPPEMLCRILRMGI